MTSSNYTPVNKFINQLIDEVVSSEQKAEKRAPLCFHKKPMKPPTEDEQTVKNFETLTLVWQGPRLSPIIPKGKLGFRLPLVGSVWSKSFRPRITRLHGGIKAREIMYQGTWPFGNLTFSTGDFVMQFHSIVFPYRISQTYCRVREVCHAK